MQFMYRFDNAGLNKFYEKDGVYAALAQTVGPLPFNTTATDIGLLVETPNGNALLGCHVNGYFFTELQEYMMNKKQPLSVSVIASELIQKLKAGAFTETPQGIKISETCYLTFVCSRDNPEKVKTLQVFNGQTTRDDIFPCNDAQVLFHEYRHFKLAQEHEGREKQKFIDSLGF